MITRLIVFLVCFTLRLTAQYTVEQLPNLQVRPYNGTLVTAIDDAVYGPYPIGFSFCFYTNVYTNFYIGSNGWVGFTIPQPQAFTSQEIPSTNFLVPKNCIMGPWYDINPGIAGFPATPLTYIYYRSEGIFPNRRLIVSWVNVPLYQCTALRATQQIVLYENGIIENSIIEKRICFAWAGGTATQGLHNINGTQALTVPGRNSTQWTAFNETWRYTPNPCCLIFTTQINNN